MDLGSASTGDLVTSLDNTSKYIHNLSWDSLKLQNWIFWKLCAGERWHLCLHMCVQMHLEWGEGMKHHFWNTRHTADHRYSSGKILRELMCLVVSFAFWQSKARTQLLMLKISKKKGVVGVLLLFYIALLWRGQNKCKLFFPDQPMEQDSPSHSSWLLFILSGLWFSYPKVTMPQEPEDFLHLLVPPKQ